MTTADLVGQKIKYCTKCLMPSTRPRIRFNEEGVCNACLWAEKKKTQVNWGERWSELEQLCNKYRARNSNKFDCIVPVSGGKDSSYVSYMMKEKMGMRPLCITIRPPIENPVGKQNLENFINCGYDHLHVTPNPAVGKIIDKDSFILDGRPMHAFMISVQTVIFRCSVLFDIPLVMWGEEGETEYGGDTSMSNKTSYDVEWSKKVYLSGVDPNHFLKKFTEKELYWWLYPSPDELDKVKPVMAHWSFFEDWDIYKHYILAKEKCGLQDKVERCLGTYNNFGQTDTYIIDLYFYLMYLKFGFGHATGDVGIDIRRGALTRKQGLSLVKRYDGEFPEAYVKDYLEFFNMTMDEFNAVLDKHANKDLFKKVGDRWVPLFIPQ